MNNYVVVRQPNDHIVLGVNEDYVIEIPMEERDDVQLVCTEKHILNFILFIIFLILAGSIMMWNLSRLQTSHYSSLKMQVIRDTMWNACLSDATKMYRLREPNDKCYRLADATWKCKMSYIKHDNTKKKKAIVVLDAPPKANIPEQRTSHKICCATTMSGKPCRFKAVCGDYCRKHRVSSTSIGNKVDVSDLLSKLDGIKIN